MASEDDSGPEGFASEPEGFAFGPVELTSAAAAKLLADFRPCADKPNASANAANVTVSARPCPNRG